MNILPGEDDLDANVRVAGKTKKLKEFKNLDKIWRQKELTSGAEQLEGSQKKGHFGVNKALFPEIFAVLEALRILD